MNIDHYTPRPLPFAPMHGLDRHTLDGLEGWGKFKKKLGLNKLKTRKFVGKVAKVIPGASLIVPTKKTLKEAAKGMAIGAAIGTAVIGGPKAILAAKKVADQVKAKQAQGNAAAEAEAEIERQAQEYQASIERQDAAPSYSAPAYNAPSNSQSSYRAPMTATTASGPTDAQGEAPKNNWLVPAGLIGAALLALGG